MKRKSRLSKYEKVIEMLRNHLDELDENVVNLNQSARFESLYNKLSGKESSEFFLALFSIAREELSNNLSICKCNNCGKFFIPRFGKPLYCDNISPQNPKKTCKQYASKQPKGPQELYRKVYMRKFARVKRSDDRATIRKEFENWNTQALKMRKEYKSGNITESEYRLWLLQND